VTKHTAPGRGCGPAGSEHNRNESDPAQQFLPGVSSKEGLLKNKEGPGGPVWPVDFDERVWRHGRCAEVGKKSRDADLSDYKGGPAVLPARPGKACSLVKTSSRGNSVLGVACNAYT